MAIGEHDYGAQSGVSDPASYWTPITPTNDLAISPRPKALYVGVAGTITAKDKDGTSAVFTVTAGQILPIRAATVEATGTTAAGIVALY